MAAYVVTARAVQFIVGSRGFLLERGAAVPEGVDEDELARLESRSYIAEVEEIVEDLEDDGQGEPAGEPEDVDLEKLTKAQLVELANDEGIDLAGATKNAEMVAAIAAAREASAIEPPISGGSDL
ncbi:MAG TPA: hypothetical protein VIK31_03300 [Propionibacteriaceae bacterium]